jgi:hypothetical protein
MNILVDIFITIKMNFEIFKFVKKISNLAKETNTQKEN